MRGHGDRWYCTVDNGFVDVSFGDDSYRIDIATFTGKLTVSENP